jgi:hypothetical protein
MPDSFSHLWHPFLDSSGLVYYYNFQTQESMRRPNSLLNQKETKDGSQQTDAAVKRIMFESGPKILDDCLSKAQAEALASNLQV